MNELPLLTDAELKDRELWNNGLAVMFAVLLGITLGAGPDGWWWAVPVMNVLAALNCTVVARAARYERLRRRKPVR